MISYKYLIRSMKVGYCQFDLSRSHKVKVIKKTKLKILFPKGMYDNNVNISYDLWKFITELPKIM